MSIVLQGSTSGSVTLQEPAVAGTTVLDLPATSGTVALTASPTFTGTATIPTATVTTLNAPSGVLATQNGMTGIAKAWVSYNASSQTIRGSFNISSVTYSSAGNYIINFTTAMPNANYSIAISTSSANSGGTSTMYAYINDNTAARSTTAFRMQSVISNGASFFDTGYLDATIFSS